MNTASIITQNSITSQEFDGLHLKRFDLSHNEPIHLESIFHDEIAFIAFENVTWYSQQNGNAYVETPDTLVIRDAGQVFSLQTADIAHNGAICREILVSPSRLRECFESTGHKNLRIDFREPILKNVRLRNSLFLTHAILESEASDLEKSTYLLAFLVSFVEETRLARSENPKSMSNGQVIKLIEYLRTYYYDNITLDELAKLIQMNPFILVRKFRKSTGLTPHQYLNNLRIIQARKFIHKGLDLKQVAVNCGFSDQSHLTRKFKSLVGVTPGRYKVLSQ